MRCTDACKNSDGELGICSPNSASIAKGIRGLSYPLLAPSWVALGPLSQEELDWGAVFLLLDGVPGFGCVLSSLGPGIRLFSRPNLSKCETNMRWPASVGQKKDEYRGSGELQTGALSTQKRSYPKRGDARVFPCHWLFSKKLVTNVGNN